MHPPPSGRLALAFALGLSLLLLAPGSPARAQLGFGEPTAAPAPNPPPVVVDRAPLPASVVRDGVPLGFEGPEPFRQVVQRIEQAATREIAALNRTRAAAGLAPLPYDVTVGVIGSSVVGVSQNPHKEVRAFGAHSDVDFLLRSDSLVEVARARGLDATKLHVHPERLSQVLPELQAAKGVAQPGLANPISIGVTSSRGMRTASLGRAVLVVTGEGTRLLEGVQDIVVPPGEGQVARPEVRDLIQRAQAEVERLQREATAGEALARETSVTSERTRFEKEARILRASAAELEASLIRPLEGALQAGTPVPQAEVARRLERFQELRVQGVEVRVDVAGLRQAVPTLPQGRTVAGAQEGPGSSHRPTEAPAAPRAMDVVRHQEALDYLRREATQRLGTPEGNALYEAYRRLREVPPGTPLASALPPAELARIPPHVVREFEGRLRLAAEEGSRSRTEGRGRPRVRLPRIIP